VRSQMAGLAEELVDYRRQVNRSNANQFFALVDQSRGRLRGVRQQTGSMLTALERRESEEVAQIRTLLDEEKGALSSYNVDATTYETDNSSVSGQLARSSFKSVQEEFADTVLQADMGAIDVYWMQKEALTREREAMRDERSRTIKELKQMYEALLEWDAEEEEEEEEGGMMIE